MSQCSDGIGPREVGGCYFNSYWHKAYFVLAIERPTEGMPWWMTVLWEDGETTTHCTSWTEGRDFVLASPDMIDSALYWGGAYGSIFEEEEDCHVEASWFGPVEKVGTDEALRIAGTLWLQANDPNGVYTDETSAEGDYPRLTLDMVIEATRQVRAQQDPGLPLLAWELARPQNTHESFRGLAR